MKKLLFIILNIVATLALHAEEKDIDSYIPINKVQNLNTFVVIISNENYKYEEAVPYALNDGSTFRLYCEKTLGIPEKNIKYVPDASLNDMKYFLSWLERVMKAYEGSARAIFYYSGHGMPDDANRQAFLLPVDGHSISPESGLSTETLYARLGALQSASTMVLLDACFSGACRDGGMMQSARSVVIAPKKDAVSGNMVVFSAAKGNETAYPYRDKKHGMFTYFFLEKLNEMGGCVNLGELSDYVRAKVSQMSVIENEKSQTPMETPEPTAEPAYPVSVKPEMPEKTKTLKEKSQGELVYWVQRRLAELGYYKGKCSGKFLAGTKKAVIAFQKDQGIYSSGLVDQKTLDALWEAEMPTPTPEPIPEPSPAEI